MHTHSLWKHCQLNQQALKLWIHKMPKTLLKHGLKTVACSFHGYTEGKTGIPLQRKLGRAWKDSKRNVKRKTSTSCIFYRVAILQQVARMRASKPQWPWSCFSQPEGFGVKELGSLSVLFSVVDHVSPRPTMWMASNMKQPLQHLWKAFWRSSECTANLVTFCACRFLHQAPKAPRSFLTMLAPPPVCHCRNRFIQIYMH